MKLTHDTIYLWKIWGCVFRLIDEFTVQAARQREEFNALQDEISGHGFGRISRLGRVRDEAQARKSGRSSSHSGYDNQLAFLLATDPGYRAAYTAATKALTQAEANAEREIAALERAISDETAQFNDMIDKAATLPDGTKVFRNADGTVYDEDGNNVTHLAGHIEWTGLEPSWEEYSKQKARLDDLNAQLLAWREYQTGVLGAARERLNETDNPPPRDKLDDIITDIEGLKPKHTTPVEQAPEVEMISVSTTAVPNLG